MSLSTFGGASANIATINGVSRHQAAFNGVNFYYDPNIVLKATLSNNFGVELMASYKWDNFKFYGGYIYANLSNPSDAYASGFTDRISRRFSRPPEPSPSTTTISTKS